MFKAYYINQRGDKIGPLSVYQILRSSSYPSGHEAILYDFENKKWLMADLNDILPLPDEDKTKVLDFSKYGSYGRYYLN